MECDRRVEEALGAFVTKVSVPAHDLSQLRPAEKRQQALQRHRLEQMTGVDLTKLPGLDVLAVERILSEIGLDMTRWPSEKHFCAWLNVAPNNRISGGKILSSKPRKNANRAAAALRLARWKLCCQMQDDFRFDHFNEQLRTPPVRESPANLTCHLKHVPRGWFGIGPVV